MGLFAAWTASVSVLAEGPNNAAPTSTRVVTAYTTPADYLRSLGEAAYKATKDPNFMPPSKNSESGVIWEPPPSKMLAALGLQVAGRATISYIPGKLTMHVEADPAWHQAFRRLHEQIGIKLVPSRRPSQ
jgi:hypothetical protein